MSSHPLLLAAALLALSAAPARAWGGPPSRPEAPSAAAETYDADASRIAVTALFAPWATLAGFSSDVPVRESKGGMALGLAATYLVHSRYFQIGPSLELFHFVDGAVHPRGEQFRAALQLDALLPIGASAEMSLGGSVGYQHLWFTGSRDAEGDTRHGNGVVFGPRLGAAVHVAPSVEVVADTRWSWGFAGVNDAPGASTIGTAELTLGAGARLSL